MKRFIVTACLLVVALIGVLYAVFYEGLYVDTDPEAPVTADFRTYARDIQVRGSDGRWEDLELRGVDVVSSLPGEAPMDFAPEAEDYLRWLEAIGEMGANTVRVYTILDSDFYEAFYAYNTTHETPLYLLQGLQVPDTANYGADDVYDEAFRDLLIQNGRAAVDVIHGRRYIYPGDTSGTGYYRRDVSEWVIGYLVGSEWDSGNIAYTNNSTLYPTSYQGTYFVTAPEACRFEALMAQIMDEIVAYETGKYKCQRVIGFINDHNNDPFQYEELYGTRFFKYNEIDAENVLPTEALQSGYYAAYRLNYFSPDYLDYLTEAQRVELGNLLYGLDTSDVYNGYLDLLGRYHTVPVVAAYGFSTARMPIYEDQPPLNEREQGEALVEVWQDAVEADWAGVVLSTWQDVWERRTWNTAYASLDSLQRVWQDVQTDGQCYGLMEFRLGDGDPVCLVDGDTAEWTEADVVVSGAAGTLSMRYDEKYLYFLAEREGFDPETDTFYIPIDTTPQSGSTYCENYQLAFERACDFVLCLDGRYGSRLVVQERYEALWALFAFETDRVDPYEEDLRDPDSPQFQTIRLQVQRKDPVPVGGWEPAATYETGRLRCGNANPESPDYDSLADFCFTEDGVEVRIPWQLLNFSDPSEMRIHQDYYENYGVETMVIDELYVGLAGGDTQGRVAMAAFPLEGWGRGGDYQERLKDSYYIVQSHWAGQ